MSETETAPQLSGKMFLFERPELLNAEQHGNLGFKKVEKQFEFCSKVRGIPVTVSEVPMAMKEYPIIFVDAEKPMLLAAVGLIDDENLMVDDKGQWEASRYIPGYIRRYPFAVAAENGGDRMAIVIDGAYEGLKEGGDVPIFENGAPTAETNSAIEFCKNYERDRHLTATICDKFKELGLLEGQNASFTPDGETEPKIFAEYLGISEEKLKGLSTQDFLQLRVDGLLPVIYGIMMSMGNWRHMLERRARRHNLTEADALNLPVNTPK